MELHLRLFLLLLPWLHTQELTVAHFLTAALGRSPRYSMCAVRWKAAAPSWLTHGTCRFVDIPQLPNGVRAGKGRWKPAANPYPALKRLFLMLSFW